MRNRIAIVVMGIAVGLAMRMIRQPELRTLLPPRSAERPTDEHGATISTGGGSEKPRDIELGR